MRFTPTAAVAAIGALATVFVQYRGSHSSTLRTHRKLVVQCEPLSTSVFFQIVNHDTGLLLHVENGSMQSGANVVQEYVDDGFHDNWSLISTGFGNYYHVVAEHNSGKALAGKVALDNWRYVPAENGCHIFNQKSGLGLSRT